MELNERTKKLDVRLLFCDAAGIRRARAVPIGGGGGGGNGAKRDANNNANATAAALRALLIEGVGLTQGCMGMPAHADMVAPESGLTPVGEVRLVPGRRSSDGDGGDNASPPPPPSAIVRPIPWSPPPGHGITVADMLDASTGRPWSCCPRAALKRVAAAARRELGLAFTVGFEIEFVLLRRQQDQSQQQQPLVPLGPSPSVVDPSSSGGWRAADDLPYASSLGLDAHALLLDEIVACCAQLGQPVVQYHSESAPGQYELALAAHHADPVAAADGALLAKEAIACVAARHGFLACFAPKPFEGAAGSGMHAHVSVVSACKEGRNLMAGGGGGESDADAEDAPALFTNGLLSPLGERFVAGLLAHLPALLPFTAPSAGSYERLRPGCWAGAFATYGLDNREAPLRITAARGVAADAAAGGGGGGPSSSSSKTNVEVKAVDATANPHAALAAILTAGLLGIKTKARLPGPPLESDPGAMAAVAPPPPLLPASLPEALAALDADKDFVQALRDSSSSLGAPLFDALVGVRRCEARLFVTPAQTALRY